MTMELKEYCHLICTVFAVNVYQKGIAKAFVPRQMEIEKGGLMVRSLVT